MSKSGAWGLIDRSAESPGNRMLTRESQNIHGVR